MVEKGELHFVVALRVRQRIVGFAQVPLAGEESLVSCCFQHRRQRPLCRRQAAALTLESHSCHTAAVGNATRLHRRTSGCATRLRIERKKRHALISEPFDVGGWHTAAGTAPVWARVTVAKII